MSELKAILGEYVFPLEDAGKDASSDVAECLPASKGNTNNICNTTLDVVPPTTGDGDDHGQVRLSASSKMVPSLEQPFTGRRNAVVGESVPADPTYWFSSTRFVEEKSEEIAHVVRDELLGSHPCFSFYAPFIKKLLEDAFELRVFEAEEVVTNPEDDGSFCYVVQGSIELVPQSILEKRKTSSRPSAWLHQRARQKRRKGEDFGREGLLHILRGPRFDYTAIALLPSAVLSIRRTVFKKIMMVNYLEPHEFLANTINYVRVFDGFSNEEKSRIAEAVEPIDFKKGDILLKSGTTPEFLYVIQQGSVEVTKLLPSGLQAQVKLLVPSECVGDAEIFSWDAKSQYDYTAYDDIVKVLRLSQDFLYEFHGNPLLQHLFEHINVTEVAGRKTLVDEIRRKDAHRVMDASESDSDVDNDDRRRRRSSNRSKKQEVISVAACDEEIPGLGEDYDEESDSLDSDDEERYICPENMKSPEVTNFLLQHFFSRKEYNRCDGVQRGISLTIFSSPRHVKTGTVLFSSEPEALPGENEKVVRARRLRQRIAKPSFDNNEQFLYVIMKGTIELLDRGGARIATVNPGGSVGEHRLLKKKSAACEVSAVVVSPEGCDIIRLPRKIYRSCLLSSYVEEYEEMCALFSQLPFSAGFPESHLLVMNQYMNIIELGTASVVLAENVIPRDVFILVNGIIRICASSIPEIYDVAKGDTVGGLEVLDGVKSRAAYITEGKVTVLRIPADQFLSVFRLGMAFVDQLRYTSRYKSLYGNHTT